MLDVAIIGTGVCGAAVARELSKFKLNVVCLEKENDVAMGTTKANSGIVHAGYDPEPNSKMAKLNVLGNKMIEKLAVDLDIPYKKCGSMVLAFTDEECKTIEKLYNRGIKNAVPNLKILNKEEILKMEANVSKEVKSALYAPSAGIISSWELAIAQLEVAVKNGTTVMLEHKVIDIKPIEDYFVITAENKGKIKEFKTKVVVNAAGVYADKIQSFIEPIEYKTVVNKGQYYLLDKNQGDLVSHVLFQCPSSSGKGVLVSPTSHGNLIVGPDSMDIDDREDTSTNEKQLEFIRKTAMRTCELINYRDSIRNFAGLRAQSQYDEFLISQCQDYPSFINLANIKSPGLTASPAIALEVLEMLKGLDFPLIEKEEYIYKRKFPRFREMNRKEKEEIISKNPKYAHVICRCETITEGEIISAVNSPIPATTLDAVKRRCNAGMGRCQGGFCSPKVLEIIARELKLKPTEIMQDKTGSYILTGNTNKGGI